MCKVNVNIDYKQLYLFPILYPFQFSDFHIYLFIYFYFNLHLECLKNQKSAVSLAKNQKLLQPSRTVGDVWIWHSDACFKLKRNVFSSLFFFLHSQWDYQERPILHFLSRSLIDSHEHTWRKKGPRCLPSEATCNWTISPLSFRGTSPRTTWRHVSHERP